jgi:hypothetical protein
MDDSIAVVVAKIDKRVTGSQFGERKRQTISSRRARHEADLRCHKRLTH